MSEIGSDEKHDVLAEAAALAGAVTGVGDMPRYLRAYYRHAADEVAGADPRRVAAVAIAHAEFAGLRPQGRALVRIRSGGDSALDPGCDVIDIVTDDMPFLVDSISMELANHDLSARLVVHPQLRVRRDVTGALREVIGPVNGGQPSHDELAESWTHIETAALAAGEAEAITADLHRVLGDVRTAVEDYTRMRAKALTLADDMLAPEGEGSGESAGGPYAPAEIAELLRWLTAGHFTFLGYREYDLENGPEGMSLHAVPGTGLGILRHDRPGPGSFATLPDEVKARALDPQRLIVTKANSRSTVHRPSYLDYIAVKRLSPAGEVVGEYRFLGLYTHAAFSETIKGIPVLRRKLAEVLAASGLAADSHDGKEVVEVLDFYPREELFMTPASDLAAICAGVHRLRERRETRLFLRKDIYGRYVSCLIYMPRDRYTTQVRLRAQEILQRAFGADQVDYSVLLGESPVARLHLVVRAERGSQLPDADPAELERLVATAVRSWDDDLVDEAARELGPQRGRELLTQIGEDIPETYKADVPASAAIGDFMKVTELRESDDDVSFELWESEDYIGGVPIAAGGVAGPGKRVWRLTIYRDTGPITLTDVLPRLQHMGVDVVDEHPYEFPGARPFWIYDFGLRRTDMPADGFGANVERVREQVEGALAALWAGHIEDDGFNALVLDAELTWRQVVMLRAYAKYLRQANIPFSQEYIERVLRSNAPIARLLVRLFESRFDPSKQAGEAERSEAIAEEIAGALDGVASLDEDRILRSYLGLITATLRTNYFAGVQADTPYLVFKLNAREVPDLPAPRPEFELFVYSPRFEGVHLRFASVARGGLRWSDRREDFRTEILGLAKAQEVKNSVIVPSGAKGGFVCKQLPDPADREAYQGEVLACYQMFISAMLDVTDNLVAGEVVPPAGVVRHDGDDPYLVVAADKGTATFSDAANEIAYRRGFWLGDAFASGGSAGYDHKKIGITARGAWESVRFYFRTLGLDVDTDDFTVVGIGDMSGDVFGNGMLLSRHIKLVAAFDHRHVFLDPDPDPEVSFAERRRLFELPRSSWGDYDRSLISAGGGVYPRSAKSIPVTPQVSEALGLEDAPASLAPDVLISAILSAPVDLLWNGGIGTYVKASNQSNADVGDRSNDAVRVDAAQVRAKVVGEGGNLGLTQEARVEYALAGGLVNTDFIDNSAGVDTSDHEVNIKILLDRVVLDGELTREGRNALLFEMTDEVAAQVLEHNYHQNQALAAARAQAPQMLHVHARYIRKLERDGRIRRRLDVLPNDREIAERRSAGRGLVSPEFSVLLAHTKIAAAQDVLASDLPDDPFLRRVLTDYFPTPLRERYASRMGDHRLHREIITTSVVNDMVDRSGITFAFRLNEETGASVPEITAAWLVARAVFDMPGFWRQVEALDGQVTTTVQVQALLEGRKLTERAARWLLHNRRPPFDVQATIDFFADGVLTVAANLPKMLAGRDLAGFDERREAFAVRNVPVVLAERIAAMVPAYSAFDIVDIARGTGRSVEETAEVYFDLADRLQIARLRDMITALPRDDRWNTMARGAIRDDLYTAHAALARDVLTVTEPGSPEQRLAQWVQRNDSAVRRANQTLTEIWESNAFTVATLSVAVRAVRTLVTASTLPT
ncbi:MAG TPA: NAD-glutamate dehydrogenase [Streptosporangiaceae bacterium]|nr:NAD-glutamate dehydrogenase [Streptosporangiaceae bacterium]